jgi:hypothetical protein
MTTTLDGDRVKGIRGKNDLCDKKEVPDSNLIITEVVPFYVFSVLK